MTRKKVLLTGATGNMGFEGLKLLYEKSTKYSLKLLVLPTASNKRKLLKFSKAENVSIVWGDLRNYDDVNKAVAGVDIVLHVGALVSPAADRDPELAWQVNYEGTKNVVNAILDREDHHRVKLVYIGTVAETGNRVAPYHWGRIGDPLVPSVFDNYALSKIAAERYVIESGLKQWVSLRQTAIMHKNILKINDGIGYHQPLNNHLEWVTAHDSGRLLLNVCSDEVEEDFWANVYNIGGGESCRFTAHQFTQKLYELLGVNYMNLENPNWYAIRNFHGHWFYDSDELEEYLHFRSQRIDDVLDEIKRELSFQMRIAKFLPKSILIAAMRRKALQGDTPLSWISQNSELKIKAFFGSRNTWESIPTWDGFEHSIDPPHQQLNHGYDHNKPDHDLDFDDIRQAAEFRGGKCLSISMEKGDLKPKLKWQCAHNHQFMASPYLVLKTGHWCEECLQPPWNFDEQAKSNPFIAQVWYADHDKQENNYYK